MPWLDNLIELLELSDLRRQRLVPPVIEYSLPIRWLAQSTALRFSVLY